MLGINDPAISVGYLLSVASLLACVIYGAKNWNKGAETDPVEIEEDVRWETKDEQIHSEV